MGFISMFLEQRGQRVNQLRGNRRRLTRNNPALASANVMPPDGPDVSMARMSILFEIPTLSLAKGRDHVARINDDLILSSWFPPGVFLTKWCRLRSKRPAARFASVPRLRTNKGMR